MTRGDKDKLLIRFVPLLTLYSARLCAPCGVRFVEDGLPVRCCDLLERGKRSNSVIQQTVRSGI